MVVGINTKKRSTVEEPHATDRVLVGECAGIYDAQSSRGAHVHIREGTHVIPMAPDSSPARILRSSVTAWLGSLRRSEISL